MPEEVLEEATEEVAESPKGGVVGLVIAIIALLAAGAAIAINLTMKPDTSSLEERLRAVESSVKINTDNIVALKDAQLAMDEQIMEPDPQGLAIVEATDYEYERTTGELKSTKDNNVVYTFETEAGPSSAGSPLVLIYGLQGSRLIIFQTESDFSPGPGYKYEKWLTDRLEYIDLNDPSKGPQPYIVPEWKKQEAQKQLDDFNQFWE